MVLLHLLGREKELQFPPVPESLELKTVPGVYHEEMTTCFCNAEGDQGPAISQPTASGASRQPPSLLSQWEMRDPHVCWALARPGPCGLGDVDEFLGGRQVSPMVMAVGSVASWQEAAGL